MKKVAKKEHESTDNTIVTKKHPLSSHSDILECTESLFPRLQRESTQDIIREEILGYSDIL